ncbi:hypothetical protein TNCV_1151461 [Trichonephila clavipes]|nr:hypothetical protein TNCV_1151461 [Trichonephila clavipes]
MIAASLSPDEYAMRIATQTESALIFKDSTRPHSLSLQFLCSRHHRERLLRWAGIKGTPYRASCKQITTVQSSGHGKTRYRSSSHLCRVSSDFSRCLPPVSSGLAVSELGQRVRVEHCFMDPPIRTATFFDIIEIKTEPC